MLSLASYTRFALGKVNVLYVKKNCYFNSIKSNTFLKKVINSKLPYFENYNFLNTENHNQCNACEFCTIVTHSSDQQLTIVPFATKSILCGNEYGPAVGNTKRACHSLA